MPRLPGINHQDAIRALQKAGFRIVRQGKHIVMTDTVRIIMIPRHNPINAFTMGITAPSTKRATSSIDSRTVSFDSAGEVREDPVHALRTRHEADLWGIA